MNGSTSLSNKRGGVVGLGNIVPIIIGLLLIFGFGLLPAPKPLTQDGMKIIGTFAGAIVLWTLCDMAWPSLLVITMFGLTPLFTIESAIAGSLGHWVITFVILNLLMAYALTRSGFTKRVTLWFMSRKFVNKGPWYFTVTFLFSALFLALFLDVMPLIAFFLSFAYEIFKELDYKKGDAYPKMVIMGIAFSLNMGFGMTPISHAPVIIILGVVEKIIGQPINMVSYMLYAIPVGLVTFAAMILVFKLVVRPDLSNFKKIDIDKIIKEEKQPMGKKEQLTVSIFAIVFIFWVVPGLLSVFAPAAALTVSLAKIGVIVPAFFGTILMIMIQVDGEPLLNFKEAMVKGVPWPVIFLIAAAMLVATAFANPAAGINAFAASRLAPAVQNVPVFVFILIVVLATVIMTNFSANVPIAIMMVSTTLPIVLASGSMSAMGLGIMIAFASQFAFCVPSAFATIAVIYGDEYSDPKKIFKVGLIVGVISALIISILSTPLTALIFG